ncbi:MAG: fructose-1,6-bisphosphatase [Bacteroidales bacterium]|jgi:fructose-1,6-bisphosphatase III|nr:fructose-1,6-bisphosphatase [Bacteroidales bacterium]MDD2204401.1 fructose-1,6-bisphosphatase [Bacteroidales bacterium]MDD3152357.1 fructose-1,6-bisphosphatase [Bacteroidales bacterium]MDD3913827.1 fructose-1,6-bisphosphatase [Bacteroidales bacterium]MDD4634326.1 fructose-1,6-bisphosphatase [Bacteroidales bacterium]
MNNSNVYDEAQIKYLTLLSHKFPNIQSVCTEIINLEAILNLPKGTEHFLTDIHGEYDTFSHVLRNASGVVRRKIDQVFGHTISEKSKKLLATLIYYPEEKLEIVTKTIDDLDNWYSVTLRRLVDVARAAADKYTRSKVRKAMPPDYAYIIDELLNENPAKKEQYYDKIINTIIEIGRANHFIIAISKFIQRLLIDRLHIIGDIYDRGPYPDKVMETLMQYHCVDIQWGNHDILWIGAASGIKSCISTVVRISARYDNLDTLEDAYGINLLPLATFAMKFYGNDPCECFVPKTNAEGNYDSLNIKLVSQMHKAIAVIEFKLESQIIKRNPDFNMQSRLLLDKINFEKATVTIAGKEYPMKDCNFPTIDPKDPFKLCPEEEELMEKLKFSFLNSPQLQKHIKFFFSAGSLYLRYNSNLLFHSCIPLNEDGSFKEATINGAKYKGKALCDMFEMITRRAYMNRWHQEKVLQDFDYVWYLWCGPGSPLFGKDQMTTFERYFIEDKTTHKENLDPYYKYRDDITTCDNILKEFGLDPAVSHIINGHVPVKVIKGESPIKADGKLLVIDGGMSKPYQKVTGIAGYTLMYDSYSLILVEHHPFVSPQIAIEQELDIISTRSLVTREASRIKVGDTDIGSDIKKQIGDLKDLLNAYLHGIIKIKV